MLLLSVVGLSGLLWWLLSFGAVPRLVPQIGDAQREVQVLLQTRLAHPPADALRRAQVVLAQRLVASGVTHPLLTLLPPRQIRVDLPPGGNLPLLTALLTEPGRVTIQDGKHVTLPPGSLIPSARYPLVVDATDLTSYASHVGQDKDASQLYVTIALRGKARACLGPYTAAHLGQRLAIALDGRVISDPVIMAIIPGPEMQLLLFGRPEAQEFFVAVKYGPLPLRLDVVRVPGTSSELRPAGRRWWLATATWHGPCATRIEAELVRACWWSGTANADVLRVLPAHLPAPAHAEEDIPADPRQTLTQGGGEA